jgi:hypothetical protein
MIVKGEDHEKMCIIMDLWLQMKRGVRDVKCFSVNEGGVEECVDFLPFHLVP